jgi:hypothetical protein
MDFVVQHRPTAKIAQVDALRTLVQLRTKTVQPEMNIKEKSKDAFCTIQTTGSYSGKNEFLDEGTMYRRQEMASSNY